MLLFFISVAILIVGYFTYGLLMEKLFKPDSNRLTPANAMTDGVDYVPMDWKNIFLIQLLNIAGLGPIFGAIAGALWGPVAFLWIVFGCIFAGGVHDYLTGMLSVRNNGASISEIAGIYLGPVMKNVMRVFSVILLILVGTVFMTGPAKLLASLTPKALDFNFWLIVVLIYYFLATMLPIDKLIGRIYPVFGLILIIMGVGITGGLVFKGYQLPPLTFTNVHPQGLPIWSLLFVTIACGAISGFHATQSPLMARCIKNERYGRRIFYGAMVAEGIIALIWAAAGIAFFHGTPGLAAAMKEGGPGGVVHTVSVSLLGTVGGILAILGVIVCPITSGDTAFRSARLTIADWLNTSQKPILKRLYIAIPLFVVGGTLSQLNFDIIWRYFAWSNQTLAMIALWVGAVYLVRNNISHWVATIPATFMTAVSITYILQAPEGFHLPITIADPAGIVGAVALFAVFIGVVFKRNIGKPVDIHSSQSM
ncbi:MAG TPA: carbon starvation protein A [Firmicutes bacterium]|jgi:carbon starvation protein CstA|nr:carbon starvation protein A [Bacillota bacterium]